MFASSSKYFLNKRIAEYKLAAKNYQKGFVILQEYIPHKFEWRCVRIGNSFFAHKKIPRWEKTSGSLLKEYCNPPFSLLDFIKNFTDRTNLSSVAIDVFEFKNNYLVNEIQCFFGQSDSYQMLIDGQPGRYCYINGKWQFEKGMFNTNQSYDLRLEHAISIFNAKE